MSSRPSSYNLICNLLLFYIGVELIPTDLFVLGVHELDSVMHRCVSILSLFFSSYRLLQFVQQSPQFYSVGPFSLSTWYMLVCLFSPQTLICPFFPLIIIIWFSQSVSLFLFYKLVQWYERIDPTCMWYLRMFVLSSLESICSVMVSRTIRAPASILISFCFMAE